MSNEEIRKASPKAVNRAFWNWMFFAHSDYNFERLQGTGFLYAMAPVIDDLYDKDDKDGRAAALMRHTAFFNTEPRMGCAIVGLSAAMEERIANGETELAEDTLPSIKTGLMGPIAGIGDTLMQAILAPLLLSIGIGIAEGGNPMGPVLYLVSFVAIVIILGRFMFNLGYHRGDEAILNLLESGQINQLVTGAGVMGCMVMGALVAKYVVLNTVVTFEMTTGTFDLQANFFDAIMPKLLPLGLTLLVYWAFDKKNVSAVKMLLIIVVAGFALGFLGII